MNKDEELNVDSVEPNQFIIGKEDHELLQAVKNLLAYAHIRVPNGDNAKLEIACAGYGYMANADKIISYSASRTRELVQYRDKLSEELHQTQTLVDQLPKKFE
ncbi:hypothetical protein RB16p167 [Escherichia phage RB16]|uniref:Conserved hypothetical phage protein n=1 Tax=Escherichia phage RB16 TaxID=2681599 RepID=D9ICM8_BPRB1|nr:hypothetical protein RB16p167 [Escherichia phage RB16]ADJ55471.1 conserved hypothetical phage protein [Escherichia phage RB16]